MTNKFLIDINVLGDYFWATEIVLIFSFSGDYLQKYFTFHLVHCYIGHQLIWMLCWKIVNIFQENSHKNQINSDIFYLHQIAVIPHQHLTKCVETHLYYGGNNIQTTSWMVDSTLSNIYPTSFSQCKTKWLTLLILSTGSAFCTCANSGK